MGEIVWRWDVWTLGGGDVGTLGGGDVWTLGRGGATLAVQTGLFI